MHTRIPLYWPTVVVPDPPREQDTRVMDYKLPAALMTKQYGPGIVYCIGVIHEPMLAQFPTLDEARAALALGWTP